MHALKVELLCARCLLGLGPHGTRTLTSLSPGSGLLAFLQQARESRPSAPSPMSTHLPCFLPLPGSQAPHTSPKTLGTPKLWKRVWLPGTHGEGGKEGRREGAKVLGENWALQSQVTGRAKQTQFTTHSTGPALMAAGQTLSSN